jgi:hypothetical protein
MTPASSLPNPSPVHIFIILQLLHTISWSHSVHATPYFDVLSPRHTMSWSHSVHATPCLDLLSPRHTISWSHSVHATPCIDRTQSTPHHALIALSPRHTMYSSHSVHAICIDRTQSTPQHFLIALGPFHTILSPVHTIYCSYSVHSTSYLPYTQLTPRHILIINSPFTPYPDHTQSSPFSRAYVTPCQDSFSPLTVSLVCSWVGEGPHFFDVLFLVGPLPLPCMLNERTCNSDRMRITVKKLITKKIVCVTITT